MGTLLVANNTDGPAPFHIDMLGALPEGAGDESTLSKLANMLFAMGFLTLLMAVATALYKPPQGLIFERYKLANYLTLAAISVAGMAELSIAFCLPSCARCRRFARGILCLSVVPFVLVVALGGFSVVMKS